MKTLPRDATPVAPLAALKRSVFFGAMSHVSGSPTGSTETMSEAIGVLYLSIKRNGCDTALARNISSTNFRRHRLLWKSYPVTLTWQT